MGKEDFKEELLLHQLTKTYHRVRGRRLTEYFSEKEIDWVKCVGVCTRGVVAKVKHVAHKEMLFNHFITYRGHVTVKKPTDLKNVLNKQGKIVKRNLK